MVKVLALHYPTLHFIYGRRSATGFEPVSKGTFSPEQTALLREADRVIVEADGARFLSASDLGAKEDADIAAALKRSRIDGAVQEMVFRKLSADRLAVFKAEQLRSLRSDLQVQKIFPSAILPSGTGVLAALVAQKVSGFFRLKVAAQEYAAILDNGAIKYFGKLGAGIEAALRRRFPEMTVLQELTAHELNCPEEDDRFLSLFLLARHSLLERDPLSFATSEEIAKALESEKLRRSFCIGAILLLLVLLSPLVLHWRIKTAEKNLVRVTSRLTELKGKAQVAREDSRETQELMSELVRLKGISSAVESKSCMLVEIAQAAPHSITLTSLSQEPRSKRVNAPVFRVAGLAGRMDEVFLYEAGLKKGRFKESRLVDTRKVGKTGSQTVFFRMEIR